MRPLQVTVQTGSYQLDNLGDRAMLEVLIDRLREHHAGIRISVFARDASRVRSLDREIEQIPVEQKGEWALLRALYIATRRVIPFADELIRKRRPQWLESIVRMKARALVNAEALANSDMLIVSGGGFITDFFPGQAWPVLERMAEAIRQKLPFALVGQGIGPLRDPALFQKAREVLPHAQLIAIREKIHSLPLLLDLGVPRELIVVTGDDGIEPAYALRSDDPGTMLGVNFRVAAYAGIAQSDVDNLRAPLSALAAKLGAPMVSLPVCLSDSVESSSDANAVSHLLGAVESSKAPATPTALMEQIASCRVVVTGSYHAAVFALAQGIPAICVFNTAYYGNKFRGLAEEFGQGCVLVDRSQPDFLALLVSAIEASWNAAEELRPSLLQAAVSQIAAGREGYARLAEIVDSLRSTSERRGAVA